MTEMYLAQFDSLRRRAESELQVGGAFTEKRVSALCVQSAAQWRSEKSQVLASAQRYLDRQMRRLFGPCGGAARQDVLVALDVDVISDGADDFAAWFAHRKAKSKAKKRKTRRVNRERMKRK